MSLKRALVRHVLTDAIQDREEFLHSVAGIPDYERDTHKDLAELRGLLARYWAEGRVTLSEEDLRTVRLACRYALIWREGFLDSIKGMPDAGLKAGAKAEIRQARSVLVAAGGVVENPILANAKPVSLAEIMNSDRGTLVRGERVGDLDVRHVSENGKPLGRVEVDAMGTVKLILADGKIINEPFETAYDAQDWLLRKFSDNLIYSIHRLTAPEEADEEPSGPRP